MNALESFEEKIIASSLQLLVELIRGIELVSNAAKEYFLSMKKIA